MGTAPPGSSYNTEGVGIPMIAGAGDYGDIYPEPKKWTTEPTRIAEPGDIIVCVRATIGDLNWADKEYCLGRGVAGIRPYVDRLDARYASHYISTKKADLSKLGTGSTFLAIRRGDLESFPVPLPPLAEQKRIAGILDAADALRAKRRESLAQLDTLLQSTFLDMFGDPVTNPMGWMVDHLANSVTLQGGFAFKSKDYCEQGVRIVKISNVHSENLKWEETDHVPDGYLERYKDFALECGDLVIALTRPIIKSLNSVKIATVGPTDSPALLNQRVARFVFPENGPIEKSYLLAYCRTQFFKSAVQKFCSESLQPNMSTKQLGSVLIAHPPLDLQRRFATFVESVERQKARMRAHLTELKALFSSLQSRAFKGEL